MANQGFVTGNLQMFAPHNHEAPVLTQYGAEVKFTEAGFCNKHNDVQLRRKKRFGGYSVISSECYRCAAEWNESFNQRNSRMDLTAASSSAFTTASYSSLPSPSQYSAPINDAVPVEVIRTEEGSLPVSDPPLAMAHALNVVVPTVIFEEQKNSATWNELGFNIHNNDLNSDTATREISAVLAEMRERSDRPEIQEHSCRAMISFATNKDNQVIIASAGGIDTICSAMQNHPHSIGIQEYGCHALGNLATNKENKIKIAMAGGIAVILSAMWKHSTHAGVQIKGCVALISLSVNSENQAKIAAEGGIHMISAAMMNHPDQPSVQEKGCWALKNLLANTDNHMKIVNADVMNMILTSMQKHWDHADVQEQACLLILRFLHISKHNNDISHQVKIVDEGGIIDVIISAMQNHSDHIGIKNAGSYVLNILFGN